MSTKRRRDVAAIDVQLVEIYEDLANVDEAIRLKAAHKLLTNFISKEATKGDQLNEIVQRLIRGLCSGRKAARLGFSIALTQSLIELYGPSKRNIPGLQSTSQLVETLTNQTQVTKSVAGQEERDHYLGRLFGLESFVKSRIFLERDFGSETWAQILDSICELARKKSWLREECGYILFTSLRTLRDYNSSYAHAIIDKVNSNGLSKTPEGVAIWVQARTEYPNLECPKGVWHHEDPLNRKEVAKLAKILKETSTKNTVLNEPDKKCASTGNWNSRLHFVWKVILTDLLGLSSEPLQQQVKSGKRTKFIDFWEHCVDENLFATSSSDERKYWGFQLFQQTLNDVPTPVVPQIFSKNFMRCLTNQLASSERYLHRAAEKVIKTISTKTRSDPGLIGPILKTLLTEPYGNLDFDKATKTKTVEQLLSQVDDSAFEEVFEIFKTLILQPGVVDEKGAATRRQLSADQLVTMLRSSYLHPNKGSPSNESSMDSVRKILALLSECAYFNIKQLPASQGVAPSPPMSQATQTMFRSRITTCLTLLSAKPKWDVSYFAFEMMKSIRDREQNKTFWESFLEADAAVHESLEKSWEYMSKAHISSTGNDSRGVFRSLKLLYCLTMLQLYNEDSEAIGILEELNDSYGSFENNNPRHHGQGSVVLMEIILSFVSKPSQLFRRLGQQVFGSCSSSIDENSLDSLLKVLGTKESLAGQADIFEPDEVAGAIENDSVESDTSDASDVEELNKTKSGSARSMMGESDEENVSDVLSASVDASDNELAIFDAKLAQALGTRPGKEDVDANNSSSTDDDMNDEEMEALDEQLGNVFRERKRVASKKNEKKDAKETIINFKCRVIELLEIYIKQQHANILALSLLMPTLTLIRTTTSPLVSSKACNMMREYARLCKGEDLPKIEDAGVIFKYLESVHTEAGKQASNAHTSACSQASLLLVKVLAAHDRESLRRVVTTYSHTQEQTLFDSCCKVKTSFFTDWLNWCNSARK